MRQIIDYAKKHKLLLWNLCMLVMAVLTGGAACMAVAPTGEGGVVGGADPDKSDMSVPGVNAEGEQNMAGQNLDGTAATASQARSGGLAEDEYDEIIAKFRPFRFPLDTDIRKQAQQKKVKGYEITHVQSGSSVLDCEVTKTIAAGDTITLSADNISGDIKMFPEYTTIYVQGVSGYKERSKDIKQGELMLFVVSNDGTNVKCEAINGPAKDGNEEDTSVPEIPAGSTLSACANACSESQMIVSPDNYQPRKKLVYLQKKILNVVFTDQFKELVKKFPFYEEDVKGEALYNFRRKASRSAWVSKQRKFVVTNKETGEEYAYTQEGVLRQVTMLMGAPDVFDFSLLTAMSMFMFTENAASNTARAYCGKNFIKRLLALKEIKTYKELGFKNYNELGIEVHAYKDNFGTIEFVHDPTLDDLGYQDFACIVDIKNARRYVETENKEYTIDLKQGVGDVREAKRYVTIQADAIALKGYNSLLVGPSAKLEAQNIADAATNIGMVSSLPTDPSDGQLVFLTAEQDGLAADKAYRYDAATGKWVNYTGAVAVA
jgi:hypothetical protein